MMRRVCAWCDKDMGVKEGDGVTHGICEACSEEVAHEMEVSFYGTFGSDLNESHMRAIEEGDSATDGECSMGPDSSERERVGLGEGEGI